MARSALLAVLFILACERTQSADPQRCRAVRVRGLHYYEPVGGPPIRLTAENGRVRVHLPAGSYTGAETQWDTEARTLEVEPGEVECVAGGE